MNVAAAALALATALVLLAGAVVPLYRELRRTRAAALEAARRAAKAAKRAAEVHEIVNQQRTDMLQYQAVLLAAMRAAGVEVPPDVSLRARPSRAASVEGDQG